MLEVSNRYITEEQATACVDAITLKFQESFSKEYGPMADAVASIEQPEQQITDPESRSPHVTYA